MSFVSVKPFVDAVASKAGAEVAAIVQHALGALGVFFYGPLFEAAEVQALRGTPLEAVLQALDLLCYGTVADMPSLPAGAQELVASGPAWRKLQQLSILSLCAGNKGGLVTYDEIAAAVGVAAADTRGIEDLVLDMITEGLLKGTFDPARRRVDVSDVEAREIRQTDTAAIDRMLSQLELWRGRCETQLRAIHSAQRAAADDSVVRKGTQIAFAAEEKARMETVLDAMAANQAALRESGGSRPTSVTGGRQGMPRSGGSR